MRLRIGLYFYLILEWDNIPCGPNNKELHYWDTVNEVDAHGIIETLTCQIQPCEYRLLYAEKDEPNLYRNISFLSQDRYIAPELNQFEQRQKEGFSPSIPHLDLHLARISFVHKLPPLVEEEETQLSLPLPAVTAPPTPGAATPPVYPLGYSTTTPVIESISVALRSSTPTTDHTSDDEDEVEDQLASASDSDNNEVSTEQNSETGSSELYDTVRESFVDQTIVLPSTSFPTHTFDIVVDLFWP